MSERTTYDVVIAGAGPVGLTLAGELALRGVRVLVADPLATRDETIKAGAITVPTAEAYARRGLLPELAAIQDGLLQHMGAFRGGADDADGADGADSQEHAPAPRPAHFAGLWDLDANRLDPADPDLPDWPAAEVQLVPQAPLEAVLGDWVARLGVAVRRGVAVTGHRDLGDGDGVEVDLGAEGSVRAGWLVGCDGGRSGVRRRAGFEFPGTDPLITGHQARVELDDPTLLPKGWHRVPDGMLVHGPFPGRILTVEFDGPPADRDAPVTAAELQASLRRLSGTDVTVTAVVSATRWTDNARQATTYRRGRVLLAGDAAHVHSPFSGQGLNLGVGDAVNLGWKLALVVRGRAGDDLLDTYTAERHPVGAWVLEWTRAQVALMRPGAHTGALRDVVADLMRTPEGNAYFVKRIAGLALRYDLGGGHRLTGARVPDHELSDGTRASDHLQDGRGLLVDLSGARAYAAAAAGREDLVAVVAATCPALPDVAAMYVRPDGMVAWATAGEASATGDLDALGTVLDRWCGTPAGAPAGAA